MGLKSAVMALAALLIAGLSSRHDAGNGRAAGDSQGRWELVSLNRLSIAPSSSTETGAHRTRR